MKSTPYLYPQYAQTAYAYGALDRLTNVYDNGNNQTHMAYASLSRKSSLLGPDLGAPSYGYNPIGPLAYQTDTTGHGTTCTSDNLNRVLTKNDLVNARQPPRQPTMTTRQARATGSGDGRAGEHDVQ